MTKAEFQEMIQGQLPPCKAWKDVSVFLKDLTGPEKAAISLSEDPRMAVFRLQLTTWKGQIWFNNTDLQAGFAVAIELGIFTTPRVAALGA